MKKIHTCASSYLMSLHNIQNSFYQQSRYLKLGLTFFALFSPLWGDESKNDKEAIYRLPDYVITASRFPEVIDELSPSVSYISLEQLESSHWQSLSDVLLQMPGAFLVSNGGMGTVTSLFTRGSESNHTTFLLNGRRLPSGFSGNYDVGQISLVNLSSVDMVRGDNSSLHGDGAIGGVVNLRSAKATIGLKQSVQVEGGSDDFTHCNYSYAFRDDRINLTFSFDKASSDGYRPKEFYERNSGNLYFAYTINEALVVDFQWYGVDSELGVPGNSNWWNSSGISNEKNFTNMELYSPQIEYKVSENSKLKLLYTYSENILESLDTGYKDGLDKEQVNSYDLSYEYNSPKKALHHLMGYSLDERKYNRIGAGTYGKKYNYKFKEMALFSQSAFRIDNHNTIKLGARYSNYNHSYNDGWTGNLQYLHRLKNFDDIRLFFKASVGSSPPEFSILKSDWEDILSDNYGLEKVRSLEFGYKQRFASKAELGMIFFRSYIDNLADSANDSNGVLRYSTVDTKQRGLEAYFRSPKNQPLSYELSYTYLDAIVEDSAEDGIYFNSDIGAQLIRRPVHKLLLAMQWKLNKKYSVGAQFIRAIDREDPSGTRFDDLSLLRLLGNYDLNEQWRIYWRIENALDEECEWTSGYAVSPRTYNLGTQLKF